MMERDHASVWEWCVDLPNTMNPDYTKALPLYMTAYDKLFEAAKTRSEFDFVLALVHHQLNSHFDPFETTKRTYRAISDLHRNIKCYETEVSLALWLYGHIVEASYPYQMIGDMLGIAAGEPHRNPIFRTDNEGRELSPGRKIEEMENRAKTLGLKSSIAPLRRSWHADLRNAIFHSNYAIVGDKLHLPAVHKTLPIPAVLTRVNRTIASFEAFTNTLDLHRAQYKDPVEVPTPPYWSPTPGKAIVVVRDGFGPVAIHDTVLDFDKKTPVILGRMSEEEIKLVEQGFFLLPKRS